MAKGISFCLGALTLLTGVRATPLRNRAVNMLVFGCNSGEFGQDISLFLEIEGKPSTPQRTQARGETIINALVRGRIYPEFIEGHHDELWSGMADCTITSFDRKYVLPVIVYASDTIQFAVLSLPLGATYFGAGLESISFGAMKDASAGNFLLGATMEGEESYFAEREMTLPKGSRSPTISNEENDVWYFTINELGVIAKDEYTPLKLATEDKIKGYISSLSKGVTLSAELYGKFVVPFKAALGDRLIDGKDGQLRVSDCDRKTSIFGEFVEHVLEVEVVVLLEGLGGNGIRFNPKTFLDRTVDEDRSCVIKIFKDESLDRNEAILGDSFFLSSDIVFSKDEGFILSPISVYNPVHPVEKRKPFPQESKPTPMMVANRYFSGKKDNGLLIGIAVGGAALIIGVVIFLIVRAKRKSRQSLGRFSPARPMVADPSECSIMSS